ncbi:MAG: biotin carboxylase N-terminal domain-containing protein [Roseiarcus sp.]|jgi:acetyl-CoA carboxylase biotin carboxylase subunit
MNIRRVFIANRGEIAVRVIRTCRSLGIESVVAASEADLDAVPARLADRTICIGPPRSSDSYLNVEAIVDAAVRAKADAVHPGYGFLSENVRLARACRARGLVFIGPTEENLEAVGDKLRARDHAVDAGLPLAPGGPVDSPAEAKALAEKIGWPLLVKAVGGGGGRGLKLVSEPSRLIETVELAMAEAGAAFADSRVYLERFVASGRHVEVQIVGDGESVIHLGDRDCSVQRRYQKLVEEAPAPDLPDRAREGMREAAVAFGRHLKYLGLGTVEFLYDRNREEFYFLEMNARIQVEHPVTEAITGLDLVAEQIAIAEGRKLRLRQDEIRFDGHAIECRLNAEDWTRDFRPAPGTVDAAIFPAGPNIRVDTHIEAGSRVPPFYDSLMAKIVVRAAERGAAIDRLKSALTDCDIRGVTTNRDMHLALLNDAEFARGGVDTAYFQRFLERRGSPSSAAGGPL